MYSKTCPIPVKNVRDKLIEMTPLSSLLSDCNSYSIKRYNNYNKSFLLFKQFEIIYKFTQGNLGAKKNRQKPISVASQEKKSKIATLVTDSAIPCFILHK